MNTRLLTRSRWRATVLAAALASLAPASSRGDTFVSGFEGNLDSSLGVPWRLVDTDGSTPDDQLWTTSFVPEGVTEGTMALQITQPADAWQAGIILDTPTLIPLVAGSDTLEFDITPSPDATWRAVWVIMQGDGLNWAQANQVDAAPGVTTHASINLSAPATNVDWKSAAAGSAGGWWQILFAIMGGDSAQPETYTIIDNVEFVGGGASLPGNFDGDTDVDGADLDIWEGSYGINGLGDTDNDTDTDGHDFLTWQQNVTPAPVIAGVPEPGTATLVAIAAAALGGFARRRRTTRAPV